MLSSQQGRTLHVLCGGCKKKFYQLFVPDCRKWHLPGLASWQILYKLKGIVITGGFFERKIIMDVRPKRYHRDTIQAKLHHRLARSAQR